MRYGPLSLLLCLACFCQAPFAGAQSPASTSAVPASAVKAGENSANLDLNVIAAMLNSNKNYECHIAARAEKKDAENEFYEIDLECHGRDMLLTFTKPYSMVENKVLRKGSHLWLYSSNKNPRPTLLSPSQFGDKLHIGPLFDILVIDWQNYSLTNLPHQVLNGKPCFVIEFKALNQSVFMDSITTWVDQKTLRPVKTDLYDEDRKTLYHSVQDDLDCPPDIDPVLRPRRFTITIDGDDTRYIYELTEIQRKSNRINWDDLLFKQ